MLVHPLGDIRGRLHHALHQRLFRSELKPLFVTLARRIERAHRQNQLDHRSPVFAEPFGPSTGRVWHFEQVAATLRWGLVEFAAHPARSLEPPGSEPPGNSRIRRLAKLAKFRKVLNEFAGNLAGGYIQEEARGERRSGYGGGAPTSGFSRSRRGPWPTVRINRSRHRRVRDPHRASRSAKL